MATLPAIKWTRRISAVVGLLCCAGTFFMYMNIGAQTQKYTPPATVALNDFESAAHKSEYGYVSVTAQVPSFPYPEFIFKKEYETGRQYDEHIFLLIDPNQTADEVKEIRSVAIHWNKGTFVNMLLQNKVGDGPVNSVFKIEGEISPHYKSRIEDKLSKFLHEDGLKLAEDFFVIDAGPLGWDFETEVYYMMPQLIMLAGIGVFFILVSLIGFPRYRA